MAEETEIKVGLSEADKKRLRDKAKLATELKLKKELEEEFLKQAEADAYELLRPKKPEEEMVSILVDLPDSTGLLTDGKLFQHGREYLVTRTVFDDMRARIADAWRVDRELSNPYAGSKAYRQPSGVTLSGRY